MLAGERVIMSASVDGEELAWKLTQISAGIKFVDSLTINPLTGQHQFGDSGYDKVHSQSICYPLHIQIAKDNKEFYLEHMANFFHQVNHLEDQHAGCLTFD